MLDVDYAVEIIVMCLELDMLQNERLTMDVIRLLSLLTYYDRSDTVYPKQGERRLIIAVAVSIVQNCALSTTQILLTQNA